jgi:hypothetical protein
MRSTSNKWILPVVFVSILGSIAGCGVSMGAEESQACQEYAAETCKTDQGCSSQNPCAFRCEKLSPPKNEQVLLQCVNELRELAIPDPIKDPMKNAMVCSQRSLKAVSCLLQSFPLQ